MHIIVKVCYHFPPRGWTRSSNIQRIRSALGRTCAQFHESLLYKLYTKFSPSFSPFPIVNHYPKIDHHTLRMRIHQLLYVNSQPQKLRKDYFNRKYDVINTKISSFTSEFIHNVNISHQRTYYTVTVFYLSLYETKVVNYISSIILFLLCIFIYPLLNFNLYLFQRNRFIQPHFQPSVKCLAKFKHLFIKLLRHLLKRLDVDHISLACDAVRELPTVVIVGLAKLLVLVKPFSLPWSSQIFEFLIEIKNLLCWLFSQSIFTLLLLLVIFASPLLLLPLNLFLFLFLHWNL